MSDFDPISLLMKNTEDRFYSEILYDKRDGVPPEPRVVEPRVLCDGIDGLLVRCFQIEPSRGTKCFKVAQITRVVRHSQPFPATVIKANRFCAGEVLPTAAPTKSPHGGFTVTIGLGSGVACPGLLHDVRIIEYLAELRLVLLDQTVTAEEQRKLESVRKRVGIESEHIRAAHAYLLGEEMLAASLDGSLFDEEESRLRDLNRNLGAAGWAPMPTLETPW